MTELTRRQQRAAAFAARHARDPHCARCGVETVLVGGNARSEPERPDRAVMARLHKRRRHRSLMCWACAGAVSRSWELQKPIDQRWADSGAYPSQAWSTDAAVAASPEGPAD